MKLTLLCVGRPRTQYLESAIDEYVTRLSRWVTFSIDVVPSSDLETESTKLLSRIRPDDMVVLLDERGVEWSTPELTGAIETWQNQSVKSVVLVVGGAYGVGAMVTQRANHVWALSRLVFPHEMVRLIVAEQLYRAYDLLNGGKYHHD